MRYLCKLRHRQKVLENFLEFISQEQLGSKSKCDFYKNRNEFSRKNENNQLCSSARFRLEKMYVKSLETNQF